MDKKAITTSQVDASLGLNACRAFENGDYKSAREALLIILDAEPNNWLARFYLAVCYQKTGQIFAAQRAFRYLYDNSGDEELKKKSQQCMLQLNAQLTEHGKPAE